MTGFSNNPPVELLCAASDGSNLQRTLGLRDLRKAGTVCGVGGFELTRAGQSLTLKPCARKFNLKFFPKKSEFSL